MIWTGSYYKIGERWDYGVTKSTAILRRTLSGGVANEQDYLSDSTFDNNRLQFHIPSRDVVRVHGALYVVQLSMNAFAF